jgi:hypothetical protein
MPAKPAYDRSGVMATLLNQRSGLRAPACEGETMSLASEAAA